MGNIKVAVAVPDRDSPGVTDQFLGARLAPLHSRTGDVVAVEEIVFKPKDDGDLERCVIPLAGKISAVIGATNVPESTRLGELSERLGLLCFVANNNPSVWNGKRHVFHIGIPSAQTAAAVALHLTRLGIRQVQLVHDRNEFQRRAAACARAALETRGIQVNSRTGDPDGAAERNRSAAELFYLLYSDEQKALGVVRTIRGEMRDTPILFGRSLLRSSFISALGENATHAWFVDLLPRSGARSAMQQEFFTALGETDIQIPTANHCFGWDAMALGCRALAEANGDCEAAIDYLESGVVLEGVAGSYRFGSGDHNGRRGIGPTSLSRWREDHIEEVVDRL